MTTELMNYEEILKQISAETSESLIASAGNFISNKGKLFGLPGSDETHNTLKCIVVDYIRINNLLPPYRPNVRVIPKCWAIGRNDKLLVPSDNSPEKQAESCEGCKNNVFGSSPTGRGKLCSNTYRLAVVPPDATAESDIWLMKVSPTGLARWGNYVKSAEVMHGPSGFLRLITEMSFNEKMEQPSLVFKAHSVHDKLDVVLKLRARAQEEIVAEPTME